MEKYLTVQSNTLAEPMASTDKYLSLPFRVTQTVKYLYYQKNQIYNQEKNYIPQVSSKH